MSSDTAAIAIVNIVFYLIKNQDVYKKLQGILDEIFPGGDKDYNYAQGSSIPYLDGIINEAMRLKPSVPGGLSRITPPEGMDYFMTSSSHWTFVALR